MKFRLFLSAAIAIVATVIGRASADDWNGPLPDPDGSVALAARLEVLAHQILRSEKLPLKALDMSAALYRAALKLDPAQSRYPRSLADILLEKNDSVGATDALNTYLGIEKDVEKVPPADLDQTAMVQLIDLHLSSGAYQGADQKLNYLHWVLSVTSFPPPVRSEAAVRAANLLFDRSQTGDALKMLDTALQLNPVNLTALRMKFVMTQATALPVDRVQQLLGILQANPADPVVASRLAEQLAQLGLVDQSAIWYFYARQLYLKTGLHADPAFALGATSEFLINGHPKEAGILSGDYVKAYPEAADGWFILLSSTKDMLIQNPSDTDAQASNTDYLHKCSIALINRLQRIRLAAGDKTATTRPIASDTDATLPDVSGDTAMLAKSAHIPGLMDAYIGAASALAWLDIYYRHDTAGADPLLKVLAQVASPKDVTLRRLQAWQKYLGGDPNGALPQLQALSSEDPLSAMGAILIELTDPAKAPTAIVQAQKLLNEHPAGVIGAVLWSELGDKNHLSIDPAPDSAQIATLIADVPDRLLQMVDNARTFYIARLDAVKPSFEYGEPILLRVTLQNISNYNIAIGDECAIHPNVWIDGFFRGQLNSQIPGGAVAIGRIDQRLALAPSESTSTVVRVDSDLLNSILNENGTFDVTLDFSMVVNPGAVKQPGPNQTEQTQFGACGYSVRIQQMIERTATPIEKQEQRDQILERLQDPDGGNKIRVMEALTNFIAKLRETNNDQYEKIVTDFNSGLKKAPTDGKPAVQAWKQYELAMLQSGDDQVKAVGAMAQDNNWQTRLLALVECQALGAEGISLADSLFTDREPIVRDFAKATAQSLAVATTQPTTPAPAAQGANNP